MRPLLILAMLLAAGCGMNKSSDPGDDFRALSGGWRSFCFGATGTPLDSAPSGTLTVDAAGSMRFIATNGYDFTAQIHGRDGRYQTKVSLGIVAGVFAERTITIVISGGIGTLSLEDRYVTGPDVYAGTAWSLAKTSNG